MKKNVKKAKTGIEKTNTDIEKTKTVVEKAKKAVIKTKNLCKSFSNNGVTNNVLNGVDLEVYDKDFTVIMGASGSGKSTLLYCISGMDDVTSGEVYYYDECISGYKEKKVAMLRRGEFGFVFQQMHLVSNLSIFENVAVPGYLNNDKTVEQTNQRATELLEKVNLKETMKRLPSQVSGGEQQRAAIARALINEPKLLFADEPTGALNRKNTKDVLELFTSINESGQSILMVTHDVKVAIRATRIIYIEDGKVVGELGLNPYREEEEKDREAKVNNWLSELSW